jgi:hypothetical protein
LRKLIRGFIRKTGIVVLILMTTVFAASCGKKADPVCPRGIKPGAVSDLGVRIRGPGIDVSWKAAEPEVGGLKFRILRSEVNPETDECPSCPRSYVLIDNLSYKNPKLKRTGGNGLTYRDINVQNGYSYSYVIVACTESGRCSDESKQADIQFP